MGQVDTPVQDRQDTSARISFETRQAIEACQVAITVRDKSIPTVDDVIKRCVNYYLEHLGEMQHAN